MKFLGILAILAACLHADPHCTIEVDQPIRIDTDPIARTLSADYASVVARCIAELSEVELSRDPVNGRVRKIFALRARVETLSAKRRET